MPETAQHCWAMWLAGGRRDIFYNVQHYKGDKEGLTDVLLSFGAVISHSADGAKGFYKLRKAERVLEVVDEYGNVYKISENADEAADMVRKGVKKAEGGRGAVPDKARDIANQVKNNNGAAPKGYKGGRTYKNLPLEDGAQKLPGGTNYKEYDVNPLVKGQNRGAERIVIGDDGTVWYTDDHYFTFTQIK